MKYLGLKTCGWHKKVTQSIHNTDRQLAFSSAKNNIPHWRQWFHHHTKQPASFSLRSYFTGIRLWVHLKRTPSIQEMRELMNLQQAYRWIQTSPPITDNRLRCSVISVGSDPDKSSALLCLRVQLLNPDNQHWFNKKGYLVFWGGFLFFLKKLPINNKTCLWI